MPLMDPLSWSVLTFGDETSLVDFYGSHALWHDELDGIIRQVLGGATITTLPLGDGLASQEQALAHQQRHDDECDALLIERGPDFQSYDLTKADSFASFMFTHATECARLARAAGL